MTIDKVTTQHPLFLDYEVSTIARRTGYNEFYVLRIKFGSAPVTRLFRRKVARAMRKPESALFLSEAKGDA